MFKYEKINSFRKSYEKLASMLNTKNYEHFGEKKGLGSDLYTVK